ncbi:hypothetical protein [Bacillus cereus]|uniref:DUF559 domain-containing protein n=1 Tax=Bacillus cereus TaxID=1396 RepID=A0A9X6W394_BACCE|nr:hypothetical protein [Bacillus cereus]PFF52190.1 hypothetical protein CN357_00110 [Bacillus cereus]PGR19183.1 hypothetical protein COA25_11190 [Bacillus cereus]PGT27578.1 hypothetical protein COC99_09875 [Bacillus cereus]
MHYNDFETKSKRYISGVISKYMDSYIRENLIWTPEQMYVDFLEYKKDSHEKGWYGSRLRIDGEWVSPNKEEELWLVSEEAESLIMDRFTKKYHKNNTLARTKGPMVDRIRFGLNWNNEYDINYGLYPGTSDYRKTEIVEGQSIIPWTIQHVENELMENYNKSLVEVLEELSQSYIEKAFYKFWIDNFYNDKLNPAIIPEISGTRRKFWASNCNDKYYFKSSDIPKEEWQRFDVKNSTLRFDFAIVNWYTQKMLLIELDGHDYHKTVGQRSKDAVKRGLATQQGFQMSVFTGSQINSNLEACFDSIKDFLNKK